MQYTNEQVAKFFVAFVMERQNKAPDEIEVKTSTSKKDGAKVVAVIHKPTTKIDKALFHDLVARHEVLRIMPDGRFVKERFEERADGMHKIAGGIKMRIEFNGRMDYKS